MHTTSLSGIPSRHSPADVQLVAGHPQIQPAINAMSNLGPIAYRLAKGTLALLACEPRTVGVWMARVPLRGLLRYDSCPT
jgi:hypothetical protein